MSRASRGLPSPTDSNLTDADSMFPSTIEEEDGSGPGAPAQGGPQRTVYPPRFSNSVYGRGQPATGSIDGIISQKTLRGQSPVQSRERIGEQPSVRKAVSDHQLLQSSKQDPIVDTDSLNDIDDTPLLSRDIDDEPEPIRTRRKSRRDMVRDRKKRDMEAMRNAKQTQDAKPLEDPPTDKCVEDEPSSRMTLSPVMVVQDEPGSGITLSPVMVVVDEKPYYPEAYQPQPAASIRNGNNTLVPNILTFIDKSGNPTPPPSSQGSPPRIQPNLDRTALLRRREWNAYREQERAVRDAKSNSLSSVAQPIKAAPTEKDLQLMLDVHREQRFREMESRLRRLENNGDVWLRALLPMLENINHSLTGALPEKEDHEWTSEEELDGAADLAGSELVVSEGRKRPMTMDQGELLGRLARGGIGMDSWAADESYRDDWSGLASLEPLMRDLASGTQVRPGTA